MNQYNTNVYQQYYTDMLADPFGPPKKAKKKRDASDPGDPILEKSIQPDTVGLSDALNKMTVVPEEQTPWEIFKHFYENAQLAKVFAMAPYKPSDITLYQMAAVLCGDQRLRLLLLPDPDRFVREITAACQTLKEMHKSDPRVRTFHTHLAHTTGV